MVKKTWLFCLALILLFTVLSRWAVAQSSFGLESRLSRLEGDNLLLRSQLSRLESQVYQFSNRPDSSQRNQANTPPPPLVPPRLDRRASTRDPIVDRLATLLVELRQRINKLEARIAAVEK